MNHKYFLFLVLMLISFSSYSQVGVSYHNSDIPFAGINYTVKDRLIPELRLSDGMNDPSVEIALMYILNKNSDKWDIYFGVALDDKDRTDLLVPVGANFYPFAEKNFGV